MIQPPASAQLLQLMATVPNAIWSLTRVNLGYAGPTVRVRRASDNALLDCFSLADVAAHCGASNGFVATAYDQSGNARPLTQATAAAQAKLYDSVTGQLLSGRTPVIQWDGTDDQLTRADLCGFAGNPAITTVLMLGAWTNTGVTAWSMGPDVASVPNSWYQGHATALEMAISNRQGGRAFACTDPALAPCYFVTKKAAGADISAAVMRQNKTLLAQTTVTASVCNLVSGSTRLGTAVTGAQWAAIKCGLHAHFGADLQGPELDALEQYLERMRVQ